MELIENIITIARAILIFLLLGLTTGCSLSTVTDERDPRFSVKSYVLGWGTVPTKHDYSESSPPSEPESEKRPGWLK